MNHSPISGVGGLIDVCLRLTHDTRDTERRFHVGGNNGKS